MNFINFAESDDLTKQNLAALASKVQYYINIILGSLAGLFVLVLCIIAAWAWFKASKADSEEQRQGELKKVKYLGIFLAVLVILWGISGIVTTILKNIWKVS